MTCEIDVVLPNSLVQPVTRILYGAVHVQPLSARAETESPNESGAPDCRLGRLGQKWSCECFIGVLCHIGLRDKRGKWCDYCVDTVSRRKDFGRFKGFCIKPLWL